MKVRADIQPEAWVTIISVDLNRANFCQWFWGFVRGWWRGDKSISVRLHTAKGMRVIENGHEIFSSEAASDGLK